MNDFFKKMKKPILMSIPLIFGMAGLAGLDGQSFLNSLFQSMTMYFLNYGDTPPNYLVEVARWTAPLATASGVIFTIEMLHDRMRNRIKYMHGNSVAVYGPETEKTKFLSKLGDCGIDPADRFVPAHRYILAGEEAENFAFYRKYRKALADHPVYLKCSSVSSQSVTDANLKLFCQEETAARLFWKKHSLYTLSKSRNHTLKIVFLGFDRLGEETLYWGLQNNIFSPEQRIEYHIFGDGTEFSHIRRGITDITDPVIFHTEGWYENLSLLEEADLLLVLEQHNQNLLLEKLLLATHRTDMDVFAGESYMEDIMENSSRLRPFYWEEEACEIQNLFEDLLLERAKCINLRYCQLYGGAGSDQAAKEAEWKKLDAFTRYSNISSADYHEVRLCMMADFGKQSDGSDLSAEELELLSHLEHIRWCRYHYLHNWQYGTPENGKSKDKVKRIHSDLVPYESLTDGEKEKDRENIRILLSVKDV